ncbi:MAG: hypothetical protein IJY23_04140 [Clostridia bacterium]|nr:hypothetical protein [Clostridia bacterium]
MSGFEIYAFVVCLIVYVMLTGVFTFMISKIFKLSLQVVRAGLDDKRIKYEYLERKLNNKGRKKAVKVFDVIFSFIVCVIMLTIFTFSLILNATENTYFENIPTLRIVKSSSMENKNKLNDYLFENNLDNQFSTFDLVFVYEAPDEFDLQLYDVVVYDIDGEKVIHRIVAIEEPNMYHPGKRLFTLQGDSISSPDSKKVTYSQIEAIYRNEKIPFIGSFIYFMQSPAGWMCIILVIVAMISSFIIENKMYEAERIRLEAMGFLLPLYEWEHKKGGKK